MTDDLLYQIALTQTPQVGAVTAKSLVSYCGGASAVFKASKKELMRVPGIGPAVVDTLRSGDVLRAAEKELVFLEKHEIQALFYTDARYPVRLRQCYDGPALVYFKGSGAELLQADRVVAMVGTRQPTEYGRRLCEEIVEGLSAYKALIVSGMAYGVDIVAHRKALSEGLPTLGVLGHGLHTIYPADHRETAMKMLENGGLLTEYPSGTKPDRDRFPARNRIISGMSDALIVVESGLTGGSMISAQLALQHEREVFAVPGRAHDPKSAGCNALIKGQRARLLECAEDLAFALQWEPAGREKAVQTRLFVDLSPDEQKLVGIIREKPEIAVDELSHASAISAGKLASLLLSLECKGMVRALPGKRYQISN